MSSFKEVDVKNFSCNPFDMIGKQWMLVTAQKDGVANALTASWGGFGVIWNHNVAYIFVRDSRYTKEFIDGSEHFSLTFFDMKKYRKALGYFGTVSGRNEDKISKAGFSLVYKDEVPYFEEAEKVIICKKLSRHLIAPEGMLDSSVIPKWYADGDFHNMYVGQIETILVKEEAKC